MVNYLLLTPSFISSKISISHGTGDLKPIYGKGGLKPIYGKGDLKQIYGKGGPKPQHSPCNPPCGR
jgi:hypothetical protein